MFKHTLNENYTPTKTSVEIEFFTSSDGVLFTGILLNYWNFTLQCYLLEFLWEKSVV